MKSRGLDEKKDSVAKEAQKEVKEAEVKQSESKPSFWAIWGNWIGVGCAVVIVLVFLMWRFGINPKRGRAPS